jgi:hypothetical protein
MDQNNTRKNRKKTLHNQTTELRTNKENRLNTTTGVATGGGRGYGPINSNLNTAFGLISCLSQGDDNIWSNLEQS